MKIKCSKCGSITELPENSTSFVCPKCNAHFRIKPKAPVQKKSKKKKSPVLPIVLVLMLAAVLVFAIIKICGSSENETVDGITLDKNYKENEVDAEAAKCFENKEYEKGLAIISTLKDENIRNQKLIENEISIIKNANVGDEVVFGKAEQNKNKKSTEWIRFIVLENKDGIVKLLSKDALFSMPFNSSDAPTSWKDSSLRAFLQNDFYNSAFSANEKSRIIPASNTNSDNALYGTKGTENTEDTVFLLSFDEAKSLSEDILKCKPSNQALADGAWTKDGFTYWWLRSAGKTPSYFADVRNNGFVQTRGSIASLSSSGVRPVIQVKVN